MIVTLVHDCDQDHQRPPATTTPSNHPRHREVTCWAEEAAAAPHLYALLPLRFNTVVPLAINFENFHNSIWQKGFNAGYLVADPTTRETAV
jgi:hypothetical protein